ncbi:vacuolar ATP synthase subunit E [Nadsonia fulvescens var. elongata DSM 6958]|uniref:Vacuolar ATP synthase subunit E n=1 Tax=Nadsonia fulvescens var. elongata DSM 6958 TaxID=857566 RepID=A0A1E3PGM7_9ASCO|nr:vacuolar ATP synthase subunit E [Nadsonia fulvescens var. elongata DSM 6958]
MSRGLSDDQVAGELRKMVEFINKEADEKAREVELKANEEYEIEKANIVRSETAAIDSLYQTKLKQASLAQQITKSTIANKMRLKVLGARQDVLDEIFEEAAKKLQEISKDTANYKKVLQGLVEEGAFSLMEKVLFVKAREQDLELAKEAAVDAAKSFEEKAKFPVEIHVFDDEFLPTESSGGVIVLNGTGKIEVNNTLEERLKLASDESLPAIRTAVFGPSKTRKFFD